MAFASGAAAAEGDKEAELVCAEIRPAPASQSRAARPGASKLGFVVFMLTGQRPGAQRRVGGKALYEGKKNHA